jgi:hypothetical protein
MIPDEAHQKTGYANPETVSTVTGLIPGKPDEPTATWSSTTTRHDASLCQHARFGCNQVGALNYDPLVTVNTVCYTARVGCMNRQAVNYGCRSTDASEPCYDSTYTSNATAESERVTRHVSALCKWTNQVSPPSPPVVPAPNADEYDLTTEVKLKLVVQGTEAELRAKEPALIAQFKALMGLANDPDVTVEVAYTLVSTRRRLQTAGSAVEVEFTSTFADASAAQAASNAMESAVGSSATSATAAFSNVGLTVLTPPVVSQNVIAIRKGDSSNAGMIAGIVGGISGGLILVGVVYMYFKRKKDKPVYPA